MQTLIFIFKRNSLQTNYIIISLQYLKKASDTKQLGELVFGTVALAYKGSSSKLHLLDDPSRLLLSCISPAPRSHRAVRARFVKFQQNYIIFE